MSNRLFQGVIHQMRDAIDRTIGVMDETSVIIACSELGRIGEVNESVNAETMASTDTFVLNGYTYKSFGSRPKPEFAVFVSGTDSEAVKYANLLAISLGSIKQYYDEKYDRNNFIKNVKEHRYDGLLFHRVIKQFMVQAGDINSKDAPMEQHLGDGDLDYTIPAEIVYPKYFHKRGMFAAARTGDDENPERASSATQFYIVTGKFFTEMELDKMEKEQGITFTPEQRQAYMLEGGTPHLDGKYTIFGEVVSGMKAVDKIQFTETNADDRPVKNIKIKSMKIVNK